MSEGRTGQPTVAVLVLAAGREATLDRCLEGIATQQAPTEFVVTVVDSAPSDGAADRALRHPAVHWVVLTSQPGLAALCRRAAGAAKEAYELHLTGRGPAGVAWAPPVGWMAEDVSAEVPDVGSVPRG